MLNLNASLTKAGVAYSTLWSEDFADDFFLSGLRQWLAGEAVRHDLSHVHPLEEFRLPAQAKRWGRDWRGRYGATRPSWASSTKGAWGCYNAISPTSCCTGRAWFKERLSQSALFAEMQQVSDEEALGFGVAGPQGDAVHHRANPETDLTDARF